MLPALESLMAAPSALIWACWPLTFASARASGRAFLPRPNGCLILSTTAPRPDSSTTPKTTAPVIFKAVLVTGVMPAFLRLEGWKR